MKNKKVLIVVAILAFAAVSLMLHLITSCITAWTDAPASEDTQVETETDVYQPIAESTLAIDPDQSISPNEESEHMTVVDDPDEEEDQPQDIDYQFPIPADELPSFDFSTIWVGEDGTETFISTSDSEGLLSLSTDESTLETAVAGKILECEDYSTRYTASEIVNSDTASAQAINTLLGGNLCTDIFVSTPDGLMQFTLDRSCDTDGHIYAEIEHFLHQRYALTMPEAATITNGV